MYNAIESIRDEIVQYLSNKYENKQQKIRALFKIMVMLSVTT